MLSTIWFVCQNLPFYDSKDSVASSSGNDIDSTKKLRKRTRKSVQFSHVEVRVHEIILGDHPSTEFYPVSLGWGHRETEIFDVEHYLHIKAIRSKQRQQQQHGLPNNHKLCLKTLRVKAIKRFDRLIEVGGYDEMELVEMERARHKQIKDDKFFRRYNCMSV
jgi:hypothetical protein